MKNNESTYDVEDIGNIRERLKYYCELTRQNEEKKKEKENNKERKED